MPICNDWPYLLGESSELDNFMMSLTFQKAVANVIGRINAMGQNQETLQNEQMKDWLS